MMKRARKILSGSKIDAGLAADELSTCANSVVGTCT